MTKSTTLAHVSQAKSELNTNYFLTFLARRNAPQVQSVKFTSQRARAGVETSLLPGSIAKLPDCIQLLSHDFSSVLLIARAKRPLLRFIAPVILDQGIKFFGGTVTLRAGTFVKKGPSVVVSV